MLKIVYNNLIFKNNKYHKLYNESEILILDKNNNLLDVVYIPIEYTKNKDIFKKECKRLYNVLF